MAFEFRLPDIGEGLTEAEVVAWLVEEGQAVRLDQPLVQIETDKAVTDIPSPRAGVVVRHGAPAGSVVRVGEVLAVIGVPEADGDRSSPPIVGTLPSPSPPPATAPRTQSARSAGSPVPEALPLVRKLARDLRVDLATVRGTGPGGRVTREDVEAAAAPTDPGATEGEERVRLSKLRRTIADNLARSWREIPHVTTFGEADATAMLAARKAVEVPVEALVIRAVLPALREHPEFNATLEGDELVLKRHYDIGVAVDTAEGLIVVVVRGADGRDLGDLGAEVARLTRAARDRSAGVAELTGQTFTVSNIGAVGGGQGTPIIPFGTTAILSVGMARDQAVVRDGRIGIAPMLPLSLSYDHRVIDGALGRRFLAAVVATLEAGDQPSV